MENKPIHQEAKSRFSETIRVEWGKRIGTGSCVALAQAKGYPFHVGAARNWPEAARLAGYTLSEKPVIGAVLVTTESSAGTGSGHVAIVEEVHDEYIIVIEQNYVSRTVSHRQIDLEAPFIRTFIHPKTT